MLYESSRLPGLLTAHNCLPGAAVNSDVSPPVNWFSFVHFCICHCFLVYTLARFAREILLQLNLYELMGQPKNSCPAVKGKFCSRAVHIGLLSVNVEVTELFYQVYLLF